MLEDLLAQQIREHGPVSYADLVELALYHPSDGFFARGAGAGRRGDFITAPEVGPLFGAVVANAIDVTWRELGEPAVLDVVEVGAGRGALAIAVRAAAPDCSAALRYVMVERSSALRDLQAEHLPVGVPGAVGPTFASVADLPSGPVRGVLLANELLDNMPFSVWQVHEQRWCEVRIALADPASTAPRFLEQLDGRRPIPDVLPLGAPEGARAPVQASAARWLRSALEVLDAGRLLVFDYFSDTRELATRSSHDWLRTYRSHDRGGDPLAELGSKDITCEVCTDQLALVREPTSFESQAEWLTRNGIGELVAEGSERWRRTGASGGLEALRGRSRAIESEALLDPAGLGGFGVAEWTAG